MHEEEFLLLLNGAIRVLEQFGQNGGGEISRDEKECFVRLQQLCSARYARESGWTAERGMIHSVFGLAHFLVTGRSPGDRIELSRSISQFCRRRFPEETLTRYLLDVFSTMKTEIERFGLWI